MNDGLGTMTYVYDTWSRLTSETRLFTDLGASYQLRYEYDLAGGLTKFYDPYNGTLSYAINSAGQVTGVTGTHYGGVSTFTSGMQYRAWGALKHESYFNNGNLNISYNGRLQMTRYGGSAADNQYFADGRVKFASSSTGDTKFDRSYTYDQVGRLTQALTGKDARGDNGEDGPYKQTYTYDVWDNMTSRNNRFWTQPDDLFTGTYVNDRNSSWTYNASGQVTQDMLHHVYNSAGLQTSTDDLIGVMSITQGYDGDGQQGVRVEDRQSLTSPITTYYMRSSVLGGQVATEIIATGFRAGTHNTHIYVNGSEIAVYDSWLNVVIGRLSNPVTGSGWHELDPLGGLIGFADPFPQNPNTTYDSLHPNEGLYLQDANPFDIGSGCELDGMPTDCSRLAHSLENGTVGVQIGAGGKIFGVNNFQPGYGGIWVSQPTPSDPEYGNTPGIIRVTDNAYKDVWVPSGGSKINFLPNDGTIYNPGKWNPIITQIIQSFIDNPDCLEAYANADVNLPALLANGIDIGPGDLFKKMTAQQLHLRPAQFNGGLSWWNDQGGVFTDAGPAITTISGNGTTDYIPKIFLRGSAFEGGVFKSSTSYLREVLAHELLHAGGWDPKPHKWTLNAQDLDWLGDRFKQVMKKCP